MKTIAILLSTLLISILIVLTIPLFNITTINFSQKLLYVDNQKFDTYLNTLKNQNIFNVLFFKDTHATLQLFPEIDSIDITRKGFNTLTITVNERKAWISCIIDGESFFIDRNGVILKQNNILTDLKTEDVFIVKGLSINDISENKIKSKTLKSLMLLKNTFDNYLPERSLLIEKTAMSSWNLIIDDNLTVLFGELDNVDTKFKRLLYFLNTTNKNKRIDYIDCRINNKLLVSYAK